MDSASSSTSTRRGVETPAMRPTKIESPGVTTAAHALEATKPANHPFAHRLASGLPNRIRVTINVASRAAEADSTVLTAFTGSVLSGACSHRIAPAAFQASQPTRLTIEPKST